MRKSVHEKFKSKINFVKPLYRKGKNDQTSKRVPLDCDRTLKLRGDGVDFETKSTNVLNVRGKICDERIKEFRVTLPGACDGEINISDLYQNVRGRECGNISPCVFRTLKDTSFCVPKTRSLNNPTRGYLMGDGMNQSEVTKNGAKIVIHKMPESWLRVYPARRIAGESTCSIIIRCVVCQLGLTTFLVLWTIIAVFVIQSFEGPHETKISIEFERDQNQLVIDLATELRQITPLSPKWRYAIERRIEDERKLTMAAVGHGAKLKPGQFWNLSGTFLFAIYVMTALGFGAPVPHTIWGRTSGLIYAALAIPTHIYLMVNASTCFVINAEAYIQSLTTNFKRKTAIDSSKSDVHNIKESSNCSRHSGALKPSKNSFIRKNVKGCLNIFCVGRGLPFIILMYYALGVVAFGLLRNKNILETIMFPLEFTTTGGLEHVESYVRVFYGLYIEGAMWLLACTLATLRRCSSTTIEDFARDYRLFVTDKCEECENDIKR
ncbi:unnamed protein product [Colias eurytheme]|nr:unnamed protein product [Colias eurytheme]